MYRMFPSDIPFLLFSFWYPVTPEGNKWFFSSYCCAHHTYYITVYGLPEDMTGGGLKTKREFIYLFLTM